MHLFLLDVGFGLVSASLLAIAATGFTLQFGIGNLFNLGFGATMTAAAFVAYECNAAGANIWLSIVAASAFGALASWLINRGVYSPFRRKVKNLFTMIMVTLAIGIILQYTIEAIWGAGDFSYTMNAGRSFHILGMILTATQLIVMGLALVTVVGLHVVLRYTRLGKAMRAVAVNERLARNCGIPVRRVVDSTWLLSGALSGLAGVTLVMDVQVLNSSTGSDQLILIVAAAVLGGIGSPYGAMLGALVIGLVSEVSAGILNPEFKDVSAFVILGVVLLLRPTGIVSSIASAKEVAH
jgi:branched-chain amino acid transport system permease protein/neutral amino acid transport system permease protein